MTEMSNSHARRCGAIEERAGSYSQIEAHSGATPSTPVEDPNQRQLPNLAHASTDWVGRSRVFKFARSALALNSARRFTLSVGFASAANRVTDLFCLLVSLFLSASFCIAFPTARDAAT